ncbi:MAG TPA: hypothetical protein VN679_01460 [Candidatus Acidoferrales bacterium]|nr:hypothetical protein [Candidatus Acidoferrales bacterium]
MSKAEILQAIEADLSDPSSQKYGEYLIDRLTRTASWALTRDRQALLEILHEWLGSKETVRALWALAVIRRLHLSELETTVRMLRQRAASGEIFNQNILFWVDLCLTNLEKNKT